MTPGRHGGWRPRRRVRVVVGGAATAIGQDLPGLVDAPHAGGGIVATGIRLGVEIGVIALGKAAMRTGHLQGRGVAADAEHRVGIEGGSLRHRSDHTCMASV